jgi:hypothetical protein
MDYSNQQIIFGGIAATAIEGHRIVTPEPATAGSYKKATAADIPVGISAANGFAIGKRLDYIVHGPHHLRLGAAVTEGQWLKADATGKGIPAAAGDLAIARAMKAGAIGELVSVYVQPYKV